MRLKVYTRRDIGKGKRSWISLPGLEFEDTEVGFNLFFLGKLIIPTQSGKKKIQSVTKQQVPVQTKRTVIEESLTEPELHELATLEEKMNRAIKILHKKHLTGMIPIPAIEEFFEKQWNQELTEMEFLALEDIGNITLWPAHDPGQREGGFKIEDRGLLWFATSNVVD